MSHRLYETSGAKPKAKGNGVFDVCILRAGWGSSGFYSTNLLESYGSATFRAGRPSFANHPTKEDYENGRDITKIMGRLITDAELREDDEGSGLWAQMKVRPEWVDFVEEYKDTIGLSIFASGEVSEGEVDGRAGLIVESFDADDPYTSVDFVVAAGAGGRVDRMIESFRQVEASSNDRREQLTTLVKDAHSGDTTYVWVRDFDVDENVVYFDKDQNGEYSVFRQAFAVVDGIASELVGEPEEVRVETTYVNVRHTAESVNTENHKENGMTPEEKAEFTAEVISAVKEALAPLVPADEETEGPDVAEVAEAVATSGLPESARKRVYEGLKVEGSDVVTLIEAEKKYIDELNASQTNEDGRVREASVDTKTNYTVTGWSR